MHNITLHPHRKYPRLTNEKSVDIAIYYYVVMIQPTVVYRYEQQFVPQCLHNLFNKDIPTSRAMITPHMHVPFVDIDGHVVHKVKVSRLIVHDLTSSEQIQWKVSVKWDLHTITYNHCFFQFLALKVKELSDEKIKKSLDKLSRTWRSQLASIVLFFYCQKINKNSAWTGINNN